MKKTMAAVLAAIMAVSLAGCSDKGNDTQRVTENENTAPAVSDGDKAVAAEDMNADFDESKATKISLNGTSADISGGGAELSEGTLGITEAGTYILSGSFDGQIYVHSKGSDIRLVLNGVTVTRADHSALLIDKADKVTLTLNDGTENSFSDGSSYTPRNSDDNADAAIFSRSDLTINGDGTLNVHGNYKHGIVCKDELVIAGGEITADALSTAVNGKDCVKISGGSITASAGKNGISSDNDEDGAKGFIAISGGNIAVNSAGDGIQAETALYISGGDLNVTTGGGSANASVRSDGMPNGDRGRWDRGDMGGMDGMQPPDGFGGRFENTAEVTNLSNAETRTSAKALKAGSAIEITGGRLDIDSSDDSLHSNGSILVKGGDITASSGDDGMHADGSLAIEGGRITIQKSYEGIEGLNITVSGGEISVTASDDGFNAAGGSDTGSADRMGRDPFAASDGESVTLTISGGSIYVDAEGDGLDSNGDFFMTGGSVFVDGPTFGGNGALDYGDFGSTAQITGGSIVAVGAAGMEAGFDESSTQYSVLHNFSASAAAASEFTVTDSSGNVIFSYTPSKSYQSVVFSCPELSEGEYTLTAGGMSEQITISSIVTSNSSGMGFGRGHGGGMQPPDGEMQPPNDRRGFR